MIANFPTLDFKLKSFDPHDEREFISVVDQSANQVFNYNSHGWIQNNVVALMRSQDESSFSTLLQKMQELPNSSNLDDNLSVEENLRRLMPSKFQDPVEISRFLDFAESCAKDDILAKDDLEEKKDVVDNPDSVPKSE